MSRSRIDPETAAKVRYMIDSCRTNGLDPVRYLDEGGALRHRASLRQDRLDTLDMIIQSLAAIPPERLPFERIPRNPIDLRNVIVTFLTELRDGLERSSIQATKISKNSDGSDR